MTRRVTIEIPGPLHERLAREAERRQSTVEKLCSQAVEERAATLDGEDDPEFDTQLAIAREGMVRYRKTLRELAK